MNKRKKTPHITPASDSDGHKVPVTAEPSGFVENADYMVQLEDGIPTQADLQKGRTNGREAADPRRAA